MLSRARNLRVRFSLRLLLVAMTLVAVCLGMWVESVRRQRAGVEWVRAAGGHIDYDCGHLLADGTFLRVEGRTVLRDAKPPGPKWLHDLLGVDYFATVQGVTLDRDEITDLAPLKNLPRLEFLHLQNSVHPKTDLSPIQSLACLEILALNYTGLEAEQLEPLLVALPNLQIASETDPQLNRDPSQR